MASKAEIKIELTKRLEDLNLKSSRASIKPEDRIAYIQSITDLEELRASIRSSYSKRNKAQTEEQDERYGRELDAGQKRMAELNQIINSSPDPLAQSIDLGETVDGVVQRLLDLYPDIHTRYKKWLHYIRMTQKQAKHLLLAFEPDDLPTELDDRLSTLGEVYVQAYLSRAMRGDQRVLTLSRTLNFIEQYTLSYVHTNVVLQDGRGEYLKKKAEKAKKAQKNPKSQNKKKKQGGTSNG